MGDLEKKNFEALRQGMNSLYKDFQALQLRMTMLEKNHVQLQAELSSSKALVAHVLGRGMGSTVKED